MCEDCMYFGGDEYDNTIRFELGHHPSCPEFPYKFESFEQKRIFATFLGPVKDEIEKRNMIGVDYIWATYLISQRFLELLK